MPRTSSAPVVQKATPNTPYTAIICGGLMGFGGGIVVGRAIPRKMAKGMRRLLDAGYSIRIFAVDEAAYRAAMPYICAKLGLAS